LALADKVRLTEKQSYERIDQLNRDLQQEHDQVVSLNQNLERLVEEQTREIKSILQHIHIGILVIQGDDLEVTATHSRSIGKLFDVRHIAGQNAVDLLFARADVSAEFTSQVHSALASCLNEDEFNFEVNDHLLPNEVTYRFDQQEGIMQFDWNPVVDMNGLIEKMLVSVRDVTELKKLELDAAPTARELEYLGEILDVSSRPFNIFMDSAQRFMADNQRLLKANRHYKFEVLKVMFINMHTIKGAARALGLQSLTPVIHEVEQKLAGVIQNKSSWDPERLLTEHDRV
jgi:PAS domain-containing protein